MKTKIKCSCISCKRETDSSTLSRWHYPCPIKKIQKKRIAWNKGLKKNSDERVNRNAIAIEKAMRDGIKNGTIKRPPMSESNKRKLSERQSLHNSGGKCKWFEVNGKKVQGTWELFFANKFEELKIKWAKPGTNNDIWKYEWEGKTKSYSPDFYLPDYDLWLEIKGYWWGRDKEKMEIVKKTYPKRKLIVVEELSIEKVLSSLN